MIRSVLYALVLHLPILGGFYLPGKDFENPDSGAIAVMVVKEDTRGEIPIKKAVSARKETQSNKKHEGDISPKKDDYPSESQTMREERKGDVGLHILKRVEPVYPETARIQGIVGVVRVALTVTADGTVEGAYVQETSGNLALDQAALRAVAQWRFQPPHQSVPAVIPVRFRQQEE